MLNLLANGTLGCSWSQLTAVVENQSLLDYEMLTLTYGRSRGYFVYGVYNDGMKFCITDRDANLMPKVQERAAFTSLRI